MKMLKRSAAWVKDGRFPSLSELTFVLSKICANSISRLPACGAQPDAEWAAGAGPRTRAAAHFSGKSPEEELALFQVEPVDHFLRDHDLSGVLHRIGAGADQILQRGRGNVH